MYNIKTRNWAGKKWVLKLLLLARTENDDLYNDPDVKFWLYTKNPLRAWITWAYFMLLSPFSEGWTYIIRPDHSLGTGYKSIY